MPTLINEYTYNEDLWILELTILLYKKWIPLFNSVMLKIVSVDLFFTLIFAFTLLYYLILTRTDTVLFIIVHQKNQATIFFKCQKQSCDMLLKEVGLDSLFFIYHL